MEIVYRPMHLSDVDKVWELFELLKEENAGVSFVEIPDKRELKKWLGNDSIFLYIAENGDGVLSAMRAIRGNDSGTRHSAVLSVATHPDYRSKGISKELVLSGLEDMRKDGVSLARLYIYSDNIPSISLALRLGFTVSGVVYRHHFDEQTKDYIDDIIFHKLL
ncbi:MAG: N-acetyltransferase family protein [Caulobacteraceae bacterium]